MHSPNLAGARERLILALDLPSGAAALEFLRALQAELSHQTRVVWVEVGLELFLAEGPALVSRLHSEGYQVFLDLKLHDIPNTVARAVRTLVPLRPALLTVHAAGGAAMLAAAADAASGSETRLLAVTVLTSMDGSSLEAIGVAAGPQEQVERLAQLASSNGIAGLVCSGHEAAHLRGLLPAAHLVTPGIRPAKSASGDQQRIMTPAEALAAGANQLVIGRPITEAAQPAEAYLEILAEMATMLHPGSG